MFKKIILLIVALMVASPAFSAMTCVNTKEYELPSFVTGKSFNIELHLVCTFDTTPGTAVAVLDSDDMNFLNGAYAYTLVVDPATPAPDAASVAIADSRGLALMTAAGNGLNLVHATATQQEYFEGPNTDHYQLINEAFPWTITVTDQATNNAVINLYIQGVTK